MTQSHDPYTYPWDEAPKKAMWAATDADGEANFYTEMPELNPKGWWRCTINFGDRAWQIEDFSVIREDWYNSLCKRPEKQEHTMTSKDEWIKIKKEQIKCLEEFNERDKGKEAVYYRNALDELWRGPGELRVVEYESTYPFYITGEGSFRFATKTPPVEPVDIPMIEWREDQCPVPDGTTIVFTHESVKGPNGKLSVLTTHSPEELDWEYITAYAPINPIIREKE